MKKYSSIFAAVTELCKRLARPRFGIPLALAMGVASLVSGGSANAQNYQSAGTILAQSNDPYAKYLVNLRQELTQYQQNNWNNLSNERRTQLAASWKSLTDNETSYATRLVTAAYAPRAVYSQTPTYNQTRTYQGQNRQAGQIARATPAASTPSPVVAAPYQQTVNYSVVNATQPQTMPAPAEAQPTQLQPDFVVGSAQYFSKLPAGAQVTRVSGYAQLAQIIQQTYSSRGASEISDKMGALWGSTSFSSANYIVLKGSSDVFAISDVRRAVAKPIVMRTMQSFGATINEATEYAQSSGDPEIRQAIPVLQALKKEHGGNGNVKITDQELAAEEGIQAITQNTLNWGNSPAPARPPQNIVGFENRRYNNG